MRNECMIYQRLGKHHRVAECLYIPSALDYLEMRYYRSGNLKAIIQSHGAQFDDDLRRIWAGQMMDTVVFAV